VRALARLYTYILWRERERDTFGYLVSLTCAHVSCRDSYVLPALVHRPFCVSHKPLSLSSLSSLSKPRAQSVHAFLRFSPFRPLLAAALRPPNAQRTKHFLIGFLDSIAAVYKALRGLSLFDWSRVASSPPPALALPRPARRSTTPTGSGADARTGTRSNVDDRHPILRIFKC
jgi:hypothetical protein